MKKESRPESPKELKEIERIKSDDIRPRKYFTKKEVNKWKANKRELLDHYSKMNKFLREKTNTSK